MEVLEDRCLLSAGALDPTFGNGAGYVITSLTNGIDNGSAPLIQPDGKIIVPGPATTILKHGSSTVVSLVRYNPDGSLDTSFGNGGEVIGPVTAYGDVTAALYPTATAPKIVVSGIGTTLSHGVHGFSIARFNANGSLDSSFGTNGIATANFGPALNTYGTDSVVVQPDGKIVALGTAGGNTVASYQTLELARFNANGTLDTTFGSGGLLSDLRLAVPITNSLLLQPDGKLLVEGQEPQGTSNGLELARYNADGSWDNTFGSNGLVIDTWFSSPASAALYPLAGTANDGKIVVGGDHLVGLTNTWALTRYNPNGSIDGTFGAGGRVTTQLPDNQVQVYAVAIQADGRIVAAGDGPVGGPTDPLGVVRYNADGSLDSTFGNSGIVTTLIGGRFVLGSNGGGMALQPNGDIVVAGSSWNGSKYNFVVARYLPSEPEIGSFTASASTVSAGSNVLLTASNITDGNPASTITQVSFYYIDGSGNKVTLGTGTQTSTGVWTLNYTVNLATGTYTIDAQAEDSYGVFGDPFALTLTVQ
jgi:uncharacterized delta-60 repeat protein